MGRVKEKRFAYNSINDYMVQLGKGFFDHTKGHWHEGFFKNKNPIVLELACGRGEYTVGLAKQFPDTNFIGVDIRGDRMGRGLQEADALGLTNIGFLRIIIHHLDQFFADGEIDEIWLVHPDPRPKSRDAKRRLTHPRFLAMYESILKPGGLLRLKTDDADLFSYSLRVLQDSGWTIVEQTDDLYQSDLLQDHYGIQTHYEKKFVGQGHTIHYCVATKTNPPPQAVPLLYQGGQ